MNKKDMLALIRMRIQELETKYRSYFDIENGPSKSVSGSACLRSRAKKDLDIMKLLQYLLLYCPDSMEIDNQELENVFTRLTEPRRLK